MSENLLAVPGSLPLTGAAPTGYPTPTKELELKLTLRSKPLTAGTTATFAGTLGQAPHRRRYPTHAELAEAIGGYPEDLAALEAYFQPFGIRVKAKSLLLGTVTLAGRVADLERAFHTQVATFGTSQRGQFLAATAAYQLPADLLPLVQHAHPLQAPVRKESRLPVKPLPPRLPGLELLATPTPEPGYSPLELAKAYHFPADLTGEGQVIGLVELGGKLNQADLKQFFTATGLKKPRIIEVGTPPVSTGTTEYINNAEVALDIQVVGALVPQARLVVYYGTTLLEALQAVVGDDVNRPSVVSVSWAGSEYNYTPAEVQQMSLLLYQASVLGITIVAASADHGAYNGLGVPNVSLPASNPLVLGCGGTIATLTDAVLTAEVVWNELGGRVASGGGYSHLYVQPSYQSLAVACYPYQRAPTRAVPDVAAHASTLAGYRVVLNGQFTAIGGTSAATPFVAALVAGLGEKLGYRLGFLNDVLYGLAGSEAFHPITQGNNQLYAAAPYWNPCTGLGSPNGEQLLALLEAQAQADRPAPVVLPLPEAAPPPETPEDAPESPEAPGAPA